MSSPPTTRPSSPSIQQATQTPQTAVLRKNDGQSATQADSINVANATPRPVRTTRCPNDYIFNKAIGEGSYSTVYLATDIHTNREHAIKVCEKQHIIREKKQKQIHRERDIMNILNDSESSFFVRLYCSFQDNENLYFVMSYAENGDLLPYINNVASFDVTCTRFYSGEILCAVEHLHNLNIMHRDLKPENILLDQKMHIKVADFGCAKIFEVSDSMDNSSTNEINTQKHRNSFVGTAHYVSPELLQNNAASPASDLWAFGCIIYQMIVGVPPFRSKSEYLLFKKIQKLEYIFPDNFRPDAKDLVQKLLLLDPNKRLGANDAKRYTSIRSHQFYSGLDFDILHTMTPPPIYPYKPDNSESQKLHTHEVPKNLKPGLDEEQLTRLLVIDVPKSLSTTTPEPTPRRRKFSGILQMNDKERQHLLNQQMINSKWHSLVQNNLIVKQGLVDKRKGLFARRRILMLTMGPHLYYADPVTMTFKGEIPWSPQLRAQPVDFKTFNVHTPNRTYHLEDPKGFALDWCKAIEEMKAYTYDTNEHT